MIDIIKNVSKITSIPKSQLDEVVNKLDVCVAHEAIALVDEDLGSAELDIGIGTLTLSCDGSNISYEFIPSNQLEKMIISAVRSGESPLAELCLDTIKERVLAVYKELL